MKYRISERGNVGIILVAIVLVGALGFVIYQNFFVKDDTATDDSTNTANSQNVYNNTDDYTDWKKYTAPDSGLAFRYPSDWSVDYYSVSEKDNRRTPHINITFDTEKVLVKNVTDFLWPTINVFDDTETLPTITSDWAVIYSEKLSNSMNLICRYRDGQEFSGGPAIQRLLIDLVDEGFDANNPIGTQVLIKVGEYQYVISGGNVAYEDGSLTQEVAKRMCESPKSGEYTTQVIQLLKSVER